MTSAPEFCSVSHNIPNNAKKWLYQILIINLQLNIAQNQMYVKHQNVKLMKLMSLKQQLQELGFHSCGGYGSDEYIR